MPWRGPAYPGEFPSLGWALEQMIARYLRVPSGKAYGAPLVLTDRQLTRLVRMYRIDPETGRFVYRRTAVEESKGTGKSPFAGAVAFCELVGPVLFDGWDADGEPVGKPHPTPWVQIAAVSEDQTDNVYVQLRDALAESDAIDEYGIDLGKTRVFLKNRPGRIEPVTASAGAREGQPVTFVAKDETRLWLPSNGGDRLNAVLSRNVAKTDGRSIELTNAYRKGQGSVAEATAEAARKKAAGLLYEAQRGPFVEDLSDRGVLIPALEVAYEGYPWVDLERIADECNDPAVTASDARCYYLNIPAEDVDEAWITAKQWRDLKRTDVEIPELADVYVGIDVALYHDNTAVVVVWRDDEGRFVVRSRTWDPKESGEVDVTEVMQHIRDLSFRYRIREAAFDPRFFDVPAKMLADENIPMVEIPQSSTHMIPACGFTYEQILAGNVVHNGDQVLEAHVLSAVQRSSEAGWTLSKNKSRRVIDACIAMVIAMYRAGQPQEATPEFAGAWL